MIKQKLIRFIEDTWRSKTPFAQVLRPLSWLFCFMVLLRKLLYRLQLLKIHKLPVPVIVVGNVTVGGTGKTPLVIWMVNFLKETGYRPGVISRGYKGKAKTWPQQVRPDSDPIVVGDEAIIIARRTGCPMAVGPDRVEAGKALLKYSECDIIVSDDGFQHYKLGRTIEVAVVEGNNKFGNGFCLPAGPLREPETRLESVDFIISKGVATHGEYAMLYTGKILVNLVDRTQRMLSDFRGSEIHAIAGIGQPEYFFAYLESQGLTISRHIFPDHHQFTKLDMDLEQDSTIIMTEKDAIKCQRFAEDNYWYLPIDIEMKKEFGLRLLDKLGECNG